jgi:DnaJ-domain-containing protein 1
MPAETVQSRVSQESGAFVDEGDSIQKVTRPLTLEGARQLLAVASTSTREQIKTAYRRMASRYHPDRLVSGTEKERQLGTDRMAAINEAYRLLSN